MAETVKYNPTLRRKLKKAGRAYIQLRGHQENSDLKSESDLTAERKNFYDANQDLFQEVIDYYFKKNSKWELGSFDMYNGVLALNAYLTETNQGIPLIDTENAVAESKGEDTQIDRSKQEVLDKIVENTDKNSTAKEQDLEEGKLSDAQRKGLQDISAWFFQNVDKTGLKAGKFSAGESAYAFVNDFILKQPARLKLMAYYLVEKKKRHNPDVLDLAESQMDYVPNLAQFKKQMVASWGKFWKRIDGSYIYWEKLGEAMRFAINAKEMINGLPGAGDMEVLGGQSSGSSGTNTSSAGTSGGNVPPAGSSASGARSSALDTREKCRVQLLRLAVAYRKVDGSDKYKSEISKQKALKKIAEEIKSTYITMRAADKQIVSEEMLDEGVGGDSTKLQSAAEYVDKGETASELPGKIVDKIGSNIAHLGDADEDGKKGLVAKGVEKLGWDLEKYDLPVFQKINMVTSTVGGVVAFVSGLLTFIDMAKHFKSSSGTEIFQNVMDTVSKAEAVAETIAGAALTGQSWAQGGEMTAKAVGEVLEKPMAVTSIVTGSVGMAVAGGRIGVEGKRLLDTSSVEGKLKGTVKDEKDRDMASNINALQARIASAHVQTAAYDMVSSGLQTIGGILALSGVAGIAGTLVSAAGTIVGIAKSIQEYFLKKSNLNATIDAYLGVGKVEADIEANIIGTLVSELNQREQFYNQIKDSPVKKIKMQELEQQRKKVAEIRNFMTGDALREEIRVRGAAIAGYPNKKSFYEKIVGDYAIFLYNKIFYDDAGEVIIESERDKNQTPERTLYEGMLKNSGLKARYPDTKQGKPKPSIQNIARKLHI